MFDEVSRATPVIADLKPGGRFMAPDMFDAGGSALLGQRLKEAGLSTIRRRSPANPCSKTFAGAKERPVRR